MLSGSHTQQNVWSHPAGFRNLRASHSTPPRCCTGTGIREDGPLSSRSVQRSGPPEWGDSAPNQPVSSLIPDGEDERLFSNSNSVIPVLARRSPQSKWEVHAFYDTSLQRDTLGCLGRERRMMRGRGKKTEAEKFLNESNIVSDPAEVPPLS